MVLKYLSAAAPVSDGGPRSIREEARQMFRRTRGEGRWCGRFSVLIDNFRDSLKSIRDPLSVVKAPSAMVEASLAKEAPYLTLAETTRRL